MSLGERVQVCYEEQVEEAVAKWHKVYQKKRMKILRDYRRLTPCRVQDESGREGSGVL